MSLTVRIKQIQLYLGDLYEMQAAEFVDHLLSHPRYSDERKLNRYEHKVFSQSGEDGIISEIFKRIGVANKTFVECAPGSGVENNTLYLLMQGWRGLWIEANPKHVRAIKDGLGKKLRDDSLSLAPQFVSLANFEVILGKAPIPEDFDLLSLDIDRNEYWVWKSLERYRPRVVVIEYNAIFPPGCDWVVEYSPAGAWDETSNYGASLTALERLGAEKGYKLVACCLAGSNAFFVRDDLVGPHFLPPFTAQNHYEPPRYYLTNRKLGHRRSVPFSK